MERSVLSSDTKLLVLLSMKVWPLCKDIQGRVSNKLSLCNAFCRQCVNHLEDKD